MNKTIQFPGNGEERLPDPKVTVSEGKVTLDQRGMIDLPFLVITIFLLAIGLVMMFSASYASAYADPDIDHKATYYFARQGWFALAGVGIMLAVAYAFDYNKLLRVAAFPLLLFTSVIMLLTPIIGLTGGGATRWISLGSFTFQPSEIAKFSVILYFANIISYYKDKMQKMKYMKPFIIVLVYMVGTLLLQRHLSGAIIVSCVAVAMVFMGGIPVKWILVPGIIGAVGLVAYLGLMGYAGARITAWRDPWAVSQGDGYQIIQSLLAIGSGGLMGLGLGRSRQKYLYLPEEHNDYIFPVVCEELGFVGAVAIILLYVLLIVRGYWIAMHAKDRFGALLVGGISTLLALQVFFNIGVVTNFLPATGISLPFFSYGGTALLIQLAEVGVILNVSRYSDNQLLI